jgi:hypothetical protein
MPVTRYQAVDEEKMVVVVGIPVWAATIRDLKRRSRQTRFVIALTCH